VNDRAERLRLAIVSTLSSVQGTAHHLPQGTLTVLAERLTQALTPIACAPTQAAAPEFFVPGRTYARDHHGCYVEFRVTAIDTSPDGKQRLARGWRTDAWSGWEPTDSDDMDGWTDVTEETAR
jgi:hypothetical protein